MRITHSLACLPLLFALCLSRPGSARSDGQGQVIPPESGGVVAIFPSAPDNQPDGPQETPQPTPTPQTTPLSAPVPEVSGGTAPSPVESAPVVAPSPTPPASPSVDPAKGDADTAGNKGEPLTVVETKVIPPKVSIISEAELSFGLARFKRGHSGWVVVDPGGGYSASPGVAFSARSLPLPGLIRVKAPPESLLQLRLDFEDGAGQGYTSKDGVSLRQVTLGRGMQQLPRNGFLWELKMPRGEGETVETVIAIGGELQFAPWEGGRTFAKRLLIDCVSVELTR